MRSKAFQPNISPQKHTHLQLRQQLQNFLRALNFSALEMFQRALKFSALKCRSLSIFAATSNGRTRRLVLKASRCTMPRLPAPGP